MATDIQARTNQGGSVVSFFVGGIVLVAIVVAGLYFLHQRGESQSPSPVISKSNAPNPNVSSSATPKATTPKQSQKPKATSTLETKPPLPATGPSDLMPVGVILAILTAISISYVQSRRAYN
ncbi:MAG: hypothetical protein WAW80_02580 [Candidatus Saccharimonadales bacterium]